MQSAKEIGELLRRTREEKGLSSEEVQTETKIRLRYLDALESGDESVIPGEVYFKGFLRFYANHLGLDGRALVEEYRRIKESQAQDQASSGTVASAAQVKPGRITEKRTRGSTVRFRFTPAIVIGLALIIVAGAALGIWWALDRRAPTQGGPPSSTGDPPDTSTPGTNPPGGVTPGASQPTVQVSKEDLGSAGLRYRVTGAALKVEIEVTARCWIQATADDGTVLDSGTEYLPGAKPTFEATNRLVIKFGNLGGTKFVISGVSQAVAGYDGQVRTVTFEKVQ